MKAMGLKSNLLSSAELLKKSRIHLSHDEVSHVPSPAV
jgi:hypothetical protein